MSNSTQPQLLPSLAACAVLLVLVLSALSVVYSPVIPTGPTLYEATYHAALQVLRVNALFMCIVVDACAHCFRKITIQWTCT